MKHLLITIFVTLFSCLSTFAQKLDISILSFEELQFDTSAQADSPLAERDSGGELYAIIKVKDNEGYDVPEGFAFDFGAVRTLKVEKHEHDLWVWVQRNAKAVTVYHPDYRTIEKHDLGMTIQPGRVYTMRVTMSRVVQIVQPTVRKQVLQFVVIPKDEHATVRVKPSNASDYELWGEVNANDGTLDRYIAFGSYDYQIEADSYDPSYGRINLAGGDTHVERVTLRPNFGFLEVTGDKDANGADIFVDNKKIGTVPYSDSHQRFTPGTHRIEIVKGDLFLPYTASFDITKGQPTRVTPQLQKDFATVTLNAGRGVRLTIDGKSVGTGSWSGPLKSGTHQIVSTLANHRDATDLITVERGKDVSRTLTPPTPITGSLYVRSTPAGATIKIDGKEMGTTPKAFSELLIGQHIIEYVLDGYASEKREVTIAENGEQQLEVTMEEDKGIKIGSKYYAVNDDNTITFTANGVKFNMIYVEGGTFTMGATAEQQNPDDDEKPTHRVTLNSYMIGETEVTQELWQAVMESNPSFFKGTTNPVEDVSWYDCLGFLRKLNSLTGQKFRLPTEAEWEYAARGGNKSKGYQYSGSNNINDVAWYTENSGSKTHPVATKAPNELGIYDMSGNVWEWCRDRYGGYSGSAQTILQSPSSESLRVGRGGSWDSNARGCRSANRGGEYPDSGCYYFGLRLVLSE